MPVWEVLSAPKSIPRLCLLLITYNLTSHLDKHDVSRHRNLLIHIRLKLQIFRYKMNLKLELQLFLGHSKRIPPTKVCHVWPSLHILTLFILAKKAHWYGLESASHFDYRFSTSVIEKLSWYTNSPFSRSFKSNPLVKYSLYTIYRINQVTVNTSYKYIENESHILRDCTLASKRVFAMPVNTFEWFGIKLWVQCDGRDFQCLIMWKYSNLIWP